MLLTRRRPSLPLPHTYSHSPPLSVSNDEQRSSKWRLKTREEYMIYVEQERKLNNSAYGKSSSTTENTNVRYFKSKRLEDIVMEHGRTSSLNVVEERGLMAFVHFLKCILEPNPWNRLTGRQALEHPFLTQAYIHDPNALKNWAVPSDPSLERRRNLHYQRKQQQQQQQYRRNQNPPIHSSGSQVGHRIPIIPNQNASMVILQPNSSILGQQPFLVQGDPISPEFSSM